MFYISKRVSKTSFAVTDTSDNTTEICTTSQIKEYTSLGIEIYGVVKRGATCQISVRHLNGETQLVKNIVVKGTLSGIEGLDIKRVDNDYVLEKVNRSYSTKLKFDLVVPDGVTLLRKDFSVIRSNSSFIMPKILHITNLVLPLSLRLLQSELFKNLIIDYIHIPNNPSLVIKPRAFCEAGLRHAIIPNKVYISESDGLFASNKYMTKAISHNKVIPSNCFRKCTMLKELELYNTEQIKESAFTECEKLTLIHLPSTIKSVIDIFLDEDLWKHNVEYRKESKPKNRDISLWTSIFIEKGVKGCTFSYIGSKSRTIFVLVHEDDFNEVHTDMFCYVNMVTYNDNNRDAVIRLLKNPKIEGISSRVKPFTQTSEGIWGINDSLLYKSEERFF